MILICDNVVRYSPWTTNQQQTFPGLVHTDQRDGAVNQRGECERVIQCGLRALLVPLRAISAITAGHYTLFIISPAPQAIYWLLDLCCRDTCVFLTLPSFFPFFFLQVYFGFYMAGLPLKSCQTIGAPSVQGSAQSLYFRFL